MPSDKISDLAATKSPGSIRRFRLLLARHAQALWHVLTTILPVILRTGKRPVLFAKYAGMGDIICTFPTALGLKTRHPGATFIYNCHPLYASLPRMGGVTDIVTTVQSDGLLWFWYRWLFTAFYRFSSADDEPESYCSENLIKENARHHGVEVIDEHPRLNIPAAARQKSDSLLKECTQPHVPLVAIQTGPTWLIKEWPREAWVHLVAALGRHGFTNIVQLGAGNHLLRRGTVEKDIIPGTVSFVGKLTLEESAAVISSSSLFVGVDSGLLHVATSLRVPSIGLFGPTLPQIILSPDNARRGVVSRVQCRGCHHRIPRLHWVTNCPYDIACMKAIAVDEVLNACLNTLESSAIRH